MGQAKRKALAEVPKPTEPLKLDIGCGSRKQPGFHGCDQIAFDGVDTVLDVRKTPWPWPAETVSEVHSSHFVEHLTGTERIGFFNELYRVMKVGAQARIITPDWSNACAYGDPTHQWPPMSGWYPLYLQKEWRDREAPHVPYTCDFDWMAAGAWEQWLNVRNDEFKQFAMQRYTNAQRDLIVTLTKRAPPA